MAFYTSLSKLYALLAVLSAVMLRMELDADDVAQVQAQ